jgi:hypothetical protein
MKSVSPRAKETIAERKMKAAKMKLKKTELKVDLNEQPGCLQFANGNSLPRRGESSFAQRIRAATRTDTKLWCRKFSRKASLPSRGTSIHARPVISSFVFGIAQILWG